MLIAITFYNVFVWFYQLCGVAERQSSLLKGCGATSPHTNTATTDNKSIEDHSFCCWMSFVWVCSPFVSANCVVYEFNYAMHPIGIYSDKLVSLINFFARALLDQWSYVYSIHPILVSMLSSSPIEQRNTRRIYRKRDVNQQCNLCNKFKWSKLLEKHSES